MVLGRWVNDSVNLSDPIKLHNTKSELRETFIKKKINQDVQENPGIIKIMTNKFNCSTNI